MKSRRVLGPAAAIAAAVALSGCSAILTATEGTHPEQRDAASDVQVQADVLNAKLAILTALATTGSLPTSTADLTEYGFTATAGVTNWVISGSGSTFCVSASAAEGSPFHATETSQPEAGPC